MTFKWNGFWKKFLFFAFVGVSLQSCNSGFKWGFSQVYPLEMEAEPSCGFNQNSVGQRLSWKGNYPLRINITSKVQDVESVFQSHDVDSSDQGISLVKTAAIKAAEKWNSATSKKLIILNFDNDSTTIPAQAASEIPLNIEIAWDPDRQIEQAVTTVRFKRNRIISASIKVNSKDYLYFLDETNEPNRLHLESLLIHEFGHLLGLKHETNLPTVMYPSLASNQVRNKLSQQDQRNIQCEY